MSKHVPLQYGRYYHIYNRGNNRQNILFEEHNYRYFLKLYAEYIELIADTYAYCLLKNHFHLLVRIKTVTEQEETVADFCQTWAGYGWPWQLGQPKRGPKPTLALSEIMTIISHFHQSH